MLAMPAGDLWRASDPNTAAGSPRGGQRGFYWVQGTHAAALLCQAALPGAWVLRVLCLCHQAMAFL